MAASSAYSVALNLFHWANGDTSRTAQVRSAFDAAMTGGALTKGGLDSLSSATKNGVTMQKLVGMNENDRITALRWAISWLDAGIAPSSRSRVNFA